MGTENASVIVLHAVEVTVQTYIQQKKLNIKIEIIHLCEVSDSSKQ
jgi:hypothetical protein